MSCAAEVAGFRTVFNYVGPGCPSVTFTVLDALGGDTGAWPRDINDTIDPNVAETVGFSYVGLPACAAGSCNPQKDPVTWPPDIDPLALARLNRAGHELRGNNNQGNIVGGGHDTADVAGCNPNAVFWQSKNSLAFNLGTVPPLIANEDTHAEGINNLSQVQVVGWNDTTDHALLWEKNGSGGWNNVTDLETAACDCSGVPGAFVVEQGHDINDSGWIAVIGDANPGPLADIHAYLLRPVSSCPADLEGNGKIDTVDFLILLGNWTGNGNCLNCNDLCCTCNGDTNGDCRVDTVDMLALLEDWGFCPGFGTCSEGAGFAGPSQSSNLDGAVQQLGFDGIEAFGAWVAGATQDEALVMGQLLAALLMP